MKRTLKNINQHPVDWITTKSNNVGEISGHTHPPNNFHKKSINQWDTVHR